MEKIKIILLNALFFTAIGPALGALVVTSIVAVSEAGGELSLLQRPWTIFNDAAGYPGGFVAGFLRLLIALPLSLFFIYFGLLVYWLPALVAGLIFGFADVCSGRQVTKTWASSLLVGGAAGLFGMAVLILKNGASPSGLMTMGAPWYALSTACGSVCGALVCAMSKKRGHHDAPTPA